MTVGMDDKRSRASPRAAMWRPPLRSPAISGLGDTRRKANSPMPKLQDELRIENDECSASGGCGILPARYAGNHRRGARAAALERAVNFGGAAPDGPARVCVRPGHNKGAGGVGADAPDQGGIKGAGGLGGSEQS